MKSIYLFFVSFILFSITFKTFAQIEKIIPSDLKESTLLVWKFEVTDKQKVDKKEYLDSLFLTNISEIRQPYQNYAKRYINITNKKLEVFNTNLDTCLTNYYEGEYKLVTRESLSSDTYSDKTKYRYLLVHHLHDTSVQWTSMSTQSYHNAVGYWYTFFIYDRLEQKEYQIIPIIKHESLKIGMPITISKIAKIMNGDLDCQ